MYFFFFLMSKVSRLVLQIRIRNLILCYHNGFVLPKKKTKNSVYLRNLVSPHLARAKRMTFDFGKCFSAIKIVCLFVRVVNFTRCVTLLSSFHSPPPSPFTDRQTGVENRSFPQPNPSRISFVFLNKRIHL